MSKAKALTLLFSILFISSFVFVNTAKADSWLSGYSYRKKITISKTNVDADLTNFPTLVKITSDSDMTTALATGYDIRFTDSDGSTLLSYERESWTGGNGSAVTAIFWVKVPTISHTVNTDIYVYYGKADATDGQDATNVWDSNFVLVYHLPNGTTLTSNDSTRNANNGTINAGPTADPGKINGGVQMANLGISRTPVTGNSKFEETYSMWVKLYDTTSFQTLFTAGDGTSSSGNYIECAQGDGANADRFVMWFWTDNYYAIVAPMTQASGDWVYLTFLHSVSNSLEKIYINGNEAASGNIYTDTSSNHNYLFIGRNSKTSSSPAFKGVMDEFRYSSTARSADWIKFEYNNMNSSNNELTFSSQLYPPAPTPTNLVATVNSTQSVTLTVDTFNNFNVGQAGYYFYNPDDESRYNSGWIQTNTWTDTDQNFPCNGVTFKVKYRNPNAIETSEISTSAKPLMCGGGGGGGGINTFFGNTTTVSASALAPISTPAPVTTPDRSEVEEQAQITLMQKIVEILREMIKILMQRRGV